MSKKIESWHYIINYTIYNITTYFITMNSSKTSPREADENALQSLTLGMRFKLEDKNKLWKKEVAKEEDIEILGMKSFKFKKYDIIVIDEMLETENNMQRIRFHIERKSEDIKDEQNQRVVFEFSRVIFVQRFRQISDMENVIENVKRVTDQSIGTY